MIIAIIQISITSRSSVMHVMANHYITIDGADYVYMHLHLYHTHTHYHTLRTNKNLTSTFSVIIIISQNIITFTVINICDANPLDNLSNNA